jgi:hypothetical protein
MQRTYAHFRERRWAMGVNAGSKGLILNNGVQNNQHTAEFYFIENGARD